MYKEQKDETFEKFHNVFLVDVLRADKALKTSRLDPVSKYQRLGGESSPIISGNF